MADEGHAHTNTAGTAQQRLAEMTPPAARSVPAAPGANKGGAKGKAGAVAGEVDEAAKKKKKRVRIIGAVALVLVVGYEVKGMVMKPHYGPGATVPAGQIVSLGSVTTNLADGHLAQITISLQMTAPASAKEEGDRSSALVGDTVAILGQQTYASLLPPSGRAHLRAVLLHAYQKVLGTTEGAQQVSAVYFTGFVLQ